MPPCARRPATWGVNATNFQCWRPFAAGHSWFAKAKPTKGGSRRDKGISAPGLLQRGAHDTSSTSRSEAARDEKASRVRSNGPVLSSTLGRPVFLSPDGHLIVPMLSPSQHGTPFAMSLLLAHNPQHSPLVDPLPATNSAGTILDDDPALPTCELLYVLDGLGELLPRGDVEDGEEADVQPVALQPGDSVIARLGTFMCRGRAAAETAAGSTAGTTAGSLELSAYGCSLAALHFVLPTSILDGTEAEEEGRRIAEEAHRQLRGPCVGRLSRQLCDTIMACARREPVFTQRRSDGSGTGRAHLQRWQAAWAGRGGAPMQHDVGGGGAGSGLAGPLESGGRAMTPSPHGGSTAHSSSELGAAPSVLQSLQGAALASLSDACRRAGRLAVRARPWRGGSRGAAGEQPQLCARAVVKRELRDVQAWRLPNQTNRLALVFDPSQADVPFTFGVEIFERNHHTKPHVHQHAHELFFILAGEGVGFCDGAQFPVRSGDAVVFPPGSTHGIDNGPGCKMYCLELMLPNEMFAEFVKDGSRQLLDDADTCVLLAVGCGGP